MNKNKYAGIPLSSRVDAAVKDGNRSKAKHYARRSIERFLRRKKRIKAINSRTSKPLPPGEAKFKRELEALGQGKEKKMNTGNKRPAGWGAASVQAEDVYDATKGKMGDTSLQVEYNTNAATIKNQLSLLNRERKRRKQADAKNTDKPEERSPRTPYSRFAPGADPVLKMGDTSLQVEYNTNAATIRKQLSDRRRNRFVVNARKKEEKKNIKDQHESTRGGPIGQFVGNTLSPSGVRRLVAAIRVVKHIIRTEGNKRGNSPSQQNKVTRDTVMHGLTMGEKAGEKAGELSKLFGTGADAVRPRKKAAEDLRNYRQEFRAMGTVSALDRETDNSLAKNRVKTQLYKYFENKNSLGESSGFRTSKAIRRDPLKIKIDTLARRLKMLRMQKKGNSPEAINVLRQLKDLRARKRNI